jgi:hypothetical protein
MGAESYRRTRFVEIIEIEVVMPYTIYIDEKEAYEYFVKFGQIARAYRIFLADHPEIIVKRSGKPPSKNSFNSAVWRYIIKNPEISKTYVKERLGEEGIVLDDDMWKSFLVRYCNMVFTTKGQKKAYLRKHGLENYIPQEIPYL